jgi:hypothetical protein
LRDRLLITFICWSLDIHMTRKSHYCQGRSDIGLARLIGPRGLRVARQPF